MYLSEPRRESLILGFSGLSDAEADVATLRLGEVFRLRSTFQACPTPQLQR